jgi:hypothetical protein
MATEEATELKGSFGATFTLSFLRFMIIVARTVKRPKQSLKLTIFLYQKAMVEI